MMTVSEKAQMFEVMFSTKEWEGNVKLPASVNQKVVLLLVLIVEDQIKEGSELFKLFPKGLSEELDAFVKECLDKAGLRVFYEKLKGLK